MGTWDVRDTVYVSIHIYMYCIPCVVCVSTGDRVVLGKGAFGTVYSAVDSVTKKKMAVKEIRESDAG